MPNHDNISSGIPGLLNFSEFDLAVDDYPSLHSEEITSSSYNASSQADADYDQTFDICASDFVEAEHSQESHLSTSDLALCENVLDRKGEAGELLVFELDFAHYRNMLASVSADSEHLVPVHDANMPFSIIGSNMKLFLAFGPEVTDLLMLQPDETRGKVELYCLVPFPKAAQQPGSFPAKVPVQLLLLDNNQERIQYFQWLGYFEYQLRDSLSNDSNASFCEEKEAAEFLDSILEPTTEISMVNQEQPVAVSNISPIRNVVIFPKDGNGHPVDMVFDWTEKEMKVARRVVQVSFHRDRKQEQIICQFKVAADGQKRNKDSILVSCIYWLEGDQFVITSVDLVYLIEELIQKQLSVDDKNRVRRNLEGYRPHLVSKSKPECFRFFRMLMAYDEPRPRNIEKDIKVFQWSIVPIALNKMAEKFWL